MKIFKPMSIFVAVLVPDWESHFVKKQLTFYKGKLPLWMIFTTYFFVFVLISLSDFDTYRLLYCFFFFVFLIFSFISPNVCHWDMFFWRGETEFTITETIIFPLFLQIYNQFFCLSDRFLSSSRKLVSATVFFPKFFSPATAD